MAQEAHCGIVRDTEMCTDPAPLGRRRLGQTVAKSRQWSPAQAEAEVYL